MSIEYEPAIDDLQTAQHVVEREFTKLSGPAIALLQSDMSCGTYLKALLSNQLLEDGLEFVGHALPVRHAIWWGCCCIGSTIPPEAMETKDRKAFAATFRWVVDPSEKHAAYLHRTTRVFVKISAPIMLARSAGFPNFKLPEPLAALKRDFKKEGVVSAVNIASVEADDLEQCRRSFLELGLRVSRNKLVWPQKRLPRTTP